MTPRTLGRAHRRFALLAPFLASLGGAQQQLPQHPSTTAPAHEPPIAEAAARPVMLEGHVLDTRGLPVAGAVVVSSAGGSAVSEQVTLGVLHVMPPFQPERRQRLARAGVVAR